MNVKTRMVAYSAMLIALSVVILYISSLLPTMKFALVAVAGLLPSAAVILLNIKSGLFVYIATAVLSFLLVPDKGNAITYALIFGHYPMVKSLIERIGNLLGEWLLKIVFFNILIAVYYFLFSAIFTSLMPANLHVVWAAFAVGNAAFIVYDIGFTRLVSVYGNMLKSRLWRR